MYELLAILAAIANIGDFIISITQEYKRRKDGKSQKIRAGHHQL